MKGLELLGSFKKDLKRIRKRGWNQRRLEHIVTLLRSGERLPLQTHPHKLVGDWEGFWECHIGPDWLLIYDSNATVVQLARTGTHADLFD